MCEECHKKRGFVPRHKGSSGQRPFFLREFKDDKPGAKGK